MRRRRQWLDATLSSPTSRRRLEDSPTRDVVRQFGNALDAVDITLQVPPRVIDLTTETDLDNTLLQDPAGDDDEEQKSGNEDQEEQEELLLPRDTSPRSSVDIEDMIERSVVRTISRAYNDMLAQISPPGTPPPPPPPTLMLPAPPAPQYMQHITPRTPPARPPAIAPPALRRTRANPHTQSQGMPLDTVLLRIRGRREPQLVVRLPGGGFSYAPSPLFSEEPTSLSSAGRRRGRRARRSRRVSEMPLVRQTPPENRTLSRRLQERLHTRENERITRLRRQLRIDEQQLGRLEVRYRDGAHSPVVAWSNLASAAVGAAAGVASAAAARPIQERLIPSFVTTEEMGVPEGKCGICLEEFKAGTSISIIPCQPEGVSGTKDHVFCHSCIQQWVHACLGQRSCPLCRGTF